MCRNKIKNVLKKNLILYITIFSVTSLFFSCKSVKLPENVEKPLDYTDEDVVKNEIKNITTLLETLPVKALWRACILGDEEVIKKCREAVETQLALAIQEKRYYDAARFEKSLASVGFAVDDEEIKSALDGADSTYDVPGFTVDESLLPQTINDCINATVTVWVDKGLKIKDGSGYADVVIGSGFFIDKRGYLITNHHVIKDLVDPKYEGFSRCYVKLPSDMETKIPAKIVGYDSAVDIALLKIESAPQFVFELGSSSDLAVGDKVSAIGTPIGLEGTLTSGIISSTDRKLNTIGNVFQLDAAVNSGNSGGPLIDENRKVQAVVFAGMLQFQGLNFAIPIEYLRQLLPALYEGGEVQHCWIGAFGHTKKEKNKKIGLEVQYVMPGGSGAFSGLKEEDVIITADKKEITSVDDFQYLLMGNQPDTIVECTYKDNEGELHTIPLYLEKRSANPVQKFFYSDLPEDSFIPIFGMKLSHSSTINRKSYTIVKIYSGTSADEMGLSENDPVTIQEYKFDYENEYFLALLQVQRHKRGFIDVMLTMGATFDSPYYF